MECLKCIYLQKSDMYVPCGKCPCCAATRRSDWATRLHFEGRLHYGSKFVTLTYADCHLKWDHGNSQLVKADLQKYFKRLRKAGAVFRYYAVGEYGSRTFRPHYHILLFGEVADSVIRKAWPFGQVHVGAVNQASIMYCLGYMVNGKSWKMKHHRTAPFCLMSRGRGKAKGLGSNYLTPAMIAWHRSGRKNYVMIDREKRHLPRYYKERIFSRIDQVRIAVTAGKENFAQMLRFIRSRVGMRMRDPLAYMEMQRRAQAARIAFKSKENLKI